jgi:hypothetical protein
LISITPYTNLRGSQNCADPEFRVKARFAPWVDIMLRFENKIRARQETYLTNSGEVTEQSVIHTPFLRRIGENVATIFGPIL